MHFCWPSCLSFLWCRIGGFQEQVQCIFVGLVASPFCLHLFSFSLLFLYRLVVWGCVFGLIGCQSPSRAPALHCQSFLIIIIIIRCNQMHPLYRALPVLSVPVLVTRLGEVFMVLLWWNSVVAIFRLWNLEGYHFTLIYFCLASI